MRVIGIDPGYAIIGFSIIDFTEETLLKREFPSLISYGIIKTEANISQIERFKEIFKNLDTLFNKYKPDIASIEKVFFTKNQKTVMQVSEIRGAFNLYFLNKNVEVFHYTPLEIKKFLTGNGKAKKKDVQIFIKNCFNLEEIPQPDDAADAIACALAYFFNYNLLNR